MERIDKSISKSYLPSDGKISLESRDYRYNSVAEFAEHGAKPLHELELKVRDPYISAEFRPMWARIYVASSEPRSAGLFYAIDKILRRSYRRLAWCYSYYFLFVLNTLLIAHGFSSHRLSAAMPYYWWTAIWWLLFAALIWILYIRLRAWSTIVPRYRRADQSFLARNRDNLIVATVAAVIGAIAGVALTLLFSGMHR